MFGTIPRPRPRPPASLLEIADLDKPCVPAHDLEEWIRATFVEDGAALYNEEHIHLLEARIGVVWCAVPLARHMLSVVGQAEIPMARGNRWAKARHDQQLVEWFGVVPDFLLTFDPMYAAAASDRAFCALVEHELYHCGQERDAYGAPKFKMDGSPKFGIRGHDVEEFVGIVRRYGASVGAGRTADFVEAALLAHDIDEPAIARVCGTCG
ncbi:putative metallopeptidase [Beijerinckia sp. L45]|uniref:putative metallopeptidase n=1 Tax=Beijerinckia sp. L45 TaxID=1641855 RepID=UPI00131C9256|nr:putative metallopeptidase [Beijerinckia sp. L45]